MLWACADAFNARPQYHSSNDTPEPDIRRAVVVVDHAFAATVEHPAGARAPRVIGKPYLTELQRRERSPPRSERRAISENSLSPGYADHGQVAAAQRNP